MVPYDPIRGRFAAGVALLLFSMQLLAADWPQFRGPTGCGVTENSNLPLRWGGFDPAAWQSEIPGRGWSSPIVVGDRIWLTTAEQIALPTTEREKKLDGSFYRNYRDQLQVHGSVACLAIEISATTGELLRRIELFTCDDPPTTHATNGYASPTPASDGQHLVCHFGSLGTACVDLNLGNVRWKRRLQFDEVTGPGSSPVIQENIVILPCDGADKQFVIGLNVCSGDTVWQTQRPKIDDVEGIHRRAFSTALVVKHGERWEAVVPGAQWVVSYDPATGRELWRVNMGDCHATIPRPVTTNGVVYVCSGYMKPRLFAIRLGGNGDVTQSHVAWQFDRQVPEISSPIIVGSDIYFVSSNGIATCLDTATGKLLWQHRLGGNFAASPIAAGSNIYFVSREGITTVIRAGSEYEELARNQHFGQTLASPTVFSNSILIRADRVLSCFENGGRAVRSPF